MNSLHHSAERLLRKHTGTMLARGQADAADVVLMWDTTPPTDPNAESDAPAPTPMCATVRAFVHYVSASAVMRQGFEFSSSDAIVTFDGAFTLTGRAALRYRLPNGLVYAQQNTARGLEELWDSTINGRRLHNTIMLRQKPGQSPVPSSPAGEICYVTSAATVQLCQYDGDGFYPVPLAGAIAGVFFDWSQYGQLTILFTGATGGTPALRADSGGVHVKALSDTLAVSFPRLEFRYGGTVLGTLTPGGTLGAPSVSDTADASCMRIQNGMDLLQAGTANLSAGSFSDDL